MRHYAIVILFVAIGCASSVDAPAPADANPGSCELAALACDGWTPYGYCGCDAQPWPSCHAVEGGWCCPEGCLADGADDLCRYVDGSTHYACHPGAEMPADCTATADGGMCCPE